MNDRIAQSKPGDYSLGQVLEFIKSFGNHGGTPQDLQALTESSKKMQAVIGLASSYSDSYARAQRILGFDFILPKELTTVLGFKYSDKELECFAKTVPDDKTLLWLKENDYMMVPGPPRPLSMKDMIDFEFSFIFNEVECENMLKGTVRSIGFVQPNTWLLLRKGPVPDSEMDGLLLQKKQLKDLESVPSAAEIVYGFSVYMKTRDKLLLHEMYLRSATEYVGSGTSVVVGYQRKDGVQVSFIPNDSKTSDVGLASKI